MATYLECTPAYGRDYASAKAVRADWAAGKDWQIASIGPDGGRYINKQDADAAWVHVLLRYARLTKVVSIRPGRVAR